ncbi:MAG: hypothetical protein ACJ8OJ_19575 [Povalibacter sp.]
MGDPTERPAELQLNAFGGDSQSVTGKLAASATKWSLTSGPPVSEKFLKPPPPEDARNWLDARAGWGLVTFERAGFTPAQYANNEDLCTALRELLQKRENAVVLRFRADSDKRFTLLRDYANSKDLDISGSAFGTSIGSIPRYLLLVGKPTPDQLPWALQYVLSLNRYVGRLPFDPLHDESSLSNYVKACLEDWTGAQCDKAATVTWAVDHSATDITHLMRRSIAEAAYQKFSADDDLKAKAVQLAAEQATHAQLQSQLATVKPALIVTTSHGMTGPLNDPSAMQAQLGLPVDQLYQPLPLKNLLQQWQPSGAIWYAHACCAAGSDDGSRFTGLFDEGTPAQQTLSGVGKLGAQVSPLPVSLLSASRPARAFLGHVEPTFDWTLKQPATGQTLTSSLVGALYDDLYLGSPVGHAFRRWYANAGTHYAAWDATRLSYDGKESANASLLYHTLAARDIQTLVLLGDPAVCLQSV